jgi:hypothetical protein
LTGKFCKHQYAIYQFFNTKSDNFRPITLADHFNIAKIAFEEQVLDKSFYDPFIIEKPEIEQVNDTETNDTINYTTIYNDTNIQELNLIEPKPSRGG